MQLCTAHYIHESDEFASRSQRNYYLGVLAKLYDEKQAKPLTDMSECRLTEDGKAIFCGVDCDRDGRYGQKQS